MAGAVASTLTGPDSEMTQSQSRSESKLSMVPGTVAVLKKPSR